MCVLAQTSKFSSKSRLAIVGGGKVEAWSSCLVGLTLCSLLDPPAHSFSNKGERGRHETALCPAPQAQAPPISSRHVAAGHSPNIEPGGARSLPLKKGTIGWPRCLRTLMCSSYLQTRRRLPATGSPQQVCASASMPSTIPHDQLLLHSLNTTWVSLNSTQTGSHVKTMQRLALCVCASVPNSLPLPHHHRW